jgi:hypothetical protein
LGVPLQNVVFSFCIVWKSIITATIFFSGVRVTWSLILCVCFVERCLFFCSFFFWSLCCRSFDVRILWYLQTLLITYGKMKKKRIFSETINLIEPKLYIHSHWIVIIIFCVDWKSKSTDSTGHCFTMWTSSEKKSKMPHCLNSSKIK